MPAINDKGFNLAESCTIVRYLAEKYGSSTLVPKDLKKRAKMNAILDWHHNNLRFGAARTFWYDFMAPNMGTTIDPALKKEAARILRLSIKFLEDTLSGSAYLAGDELTFADLFVYSELRQLDLVQFDFGQYKAISAWMAKLRKVPNHESVFDVLEKVKAAAAKKRAASAGNAGQAKL